MGNQGLRVSQSVAVSISYGVGKTGFLDEISANDSKRMVKALVKQGIIEKDNAHHFTSSEMSKKTFHFQEYAKKAGSEGIFVLHFSCHGNNEGGIRLGEKVTISAKYISDHWLSEIEAKYIVIVLDLCHAEIIGKQLERCSKNENLLILSSCKAEEVAISSRPLGYSVYTFFLSQCIPKLGSPASLPGLKDVIKECQVCCESFSSMFMEYSRFHGKVQVMSMHPQDRFTASASEVLSVGYQCLQPTHLRISHFQYFWSKFSNLLIFAHTNILQSKHSISVFFEILQYFQQKISKNTDKSVQLEALGDCDTGISTSEGASNSFTDCLLLLLNYNSPLDKKSLEESHTLSKKSLDYLKSLKEPLEKLKNRGFLDKIMYATFCAIMYSIACFERLCDNVIKKDMSSCIVMCITVFREIASTIANVAEHIRDYTKFQVFKTFESTWLQYIYGYGIDLSEDNCNIMDRFVASQLNPHMHAEEYRMKQKMILLE